ncbi:MAG: hypothetical protein DDT34_02117 [Firmicutes bacterium]|nr:hypothetical protein [Bacillota bacterium]
MTPTRTSAALMVNSTKNVLLEDVYGDFVDPITVDALNTTIRGGGGTNGVVGRASVYGSHFGSAFTSDTAGRVWLAMNEPTAATLPFTSSRFSPGRGFTSAGGVILSSVGDFFICEMQETRLQTTGFANIAPTITGTNAANHSFEYQLDNGSGFSSVWRTLNAANLFSEVISPSVGYRIRIKVECTIASPTNLISFVRFDVVTTLAAQLNNLYPLDTNAVELTGLQPNTEVRAFRGTDPSTAVEIAGVENTSGTFTFNHSIGGQQGYIVIASLGFENITLPITYSASDVSFPIQQRADRNFNNA